MSETDSTPGRFTTKRQPSSQTARAVVKLQAEQPDARVVYVSATGASDLSHMAYMEVRSTKWGGVLIFGQKRLGLWGEGTAFPNCKTFIKDLSSRGVGAMELVAMDMKV